MKTGTFAAHRLALAATLVICAAAALLFTVSARNPTNPRATLTKDHEIDLDRAIPVALPELARELRPAAFQTSDGKAGWAVRLPGQKPIATPAYADGLLFVGGGYGSHEFYALDAETGRVVWQMKTADDGPTAAVVEDGCVAFNTESCTVIVADARTGRVLWQEWLGDPLMSQPAIANGKLYMAYPFDGRKNQRQQAKPKATGAPGHRLLCADLKTGRHLWEQPISGDVITAPVIAGGQALFTCFDGTSYCLDAASGKLLWQKQNAGTSAPLVAGGNVVMTMKEMKDGQAYEGMKRLETRSGNDRDRELLARDKAAYLHADKGGGVALQQKEIATLDAAVGFGSAPPAAKLGAANQHLGVKSVVGAWAYQGARAAYRNGQMMNAQGRYLNSIKASDGRTAWRAEVKGKDIGADAQVFAPPALGALNLYLCSAQGHLAAVRQTDGTAVFLYALNQPMAFQPALARGNVYAGTNNGLVICLKTGDRDAEGWYAWGGNAQHNKN